MPITQQLRQHRYFHPNRSGRDFAVGDTHGEYFKLKQALQSRDFDPERDRLFALGDIIDRGPDSRRMLGLLEEPWFFCVLGNHELMLLEALNGQAGPALHQMNGGDWFYRLAGTEQQRLGASMAKHLALAFTIGTEWGAVGAIHATAPEDWRTVQEVPQTADAWHELVWSREDYNVARRVPEAIPPVLGIDAVLHGHVSCEAPQRAANRLWIDTLYRGGELTLVSLETPLF